MNTQDKNKQIRKYPTLHQVIKQNEALKVNEDRLYYCQNIDDKTFGVECRNVLKYTEKPQYTEYTEIVVLENGRN